MPPYHFQSAVCASFDWDGRIHGGLVSLLAELFPAAVGHEITHRWGGPLAVARDWHPSVGLDPSRGMAWAGGYVGDGVATANLAGARDRSPARLLSRGTGGRLG